MFSHLQKIGEEQIKEFKVPNALPLVYEFDENLNHINNYALMDKDAHKIKSQNRELSYNNILMEHYISEKEGIDAVRDNHEQYKI